MALEVSGQVSLIGEADARSYLGGRFPVEQAPAGGTDSLADDILVGGDPERSLEAASKMCRTGPDRGPGRSQCRLFEEAVVEEGPECVGEIPRPLRWPAQ